MTISELNKSHIISKFIPLPSINLSTSILTQYKPSDKPLFVACEEREAKLQEFHRLGLCDDSYELLDEIASDPTFNKLSADWITKYAAKRLNGMISFGKGRQMRLVETLLETMKGAESKGITLDSDGIRIVGRDPLSNVDLGWVEELFTKAAKTLHPAADKIFTPILCENLKKPTGDVDYNAISTKDKNGKPTLWKQVVELKESFYLSLSKLLPDCDSYIDKDRIYHVQNSHELGAFWENRHAINGKNTEEGLILSGIKATYEGEIDTDVSFGNRFKDTLFSPTNCSVVIDPKSIHLNPDGTVDESKLEVHIESKGCNLLKTLWDAGYGLIADHPESSYNEKAISAHSKNILKGGLCNGTHLVPKLVKAALNPYNIYSIGFSTYKEVIKVTNKFVKESPIIQLATALMQEFAFLDHVPNLDRNIVKRQMNRMWALLNGDKHFKHPLTYLRNACGLSSQFIVSPWLIGGLIKLGLQSSDDISVKKSNATLISFEKVPALQLKLEKHSAASAQFKLDIAALCATLNDSISSYVSRKNLDLLLSEAVRIVDFESLSQSDKASILSKDPRVLGHFNANDVFKRTKELLLQRHAYYHLCATALLFGYWQTKQDKVVLNQLLFRAIPLLLSVQHKGLNDLAHKILTDIIPGYKLVETTNYNAIRLSICAQLFACGKDDLAGLAQEYANTVKHLEQDETYKKVMAPVLKHIALAQETLIPHLSQDTITEMIKEKENPINSLIDELVKAKEDPMASAINEMENGDASNDSLKARAQGLVKDFCDLERVSREDFKLYSNLFKELPEQWTTLRHLFAEKLLEHLSIHDYKISGKQQMIVLLIDQLLSVEDVTIFNEKQRIRILEQLGRLEVDNFSNTTKLKQLVKTHLKTLINGINDSEGLTQVAFALAPHTELLHIEEEAWQQLINAVITSLSKVDQKAIVDLLTTFQPYMTDDQQRQCAYAIFINVHRLQLNHIQKWLPLLDPERFSVEECAICWKKASYIIDNKAQVHPYLIKVLKELSIPQASSNTFLESNNERFLKLMQECRNLNLLSFAEALKVFKDSSFHVELATIVLEIMQEKLEEEDILPHIVIEHVLDISQRHPSIIKSFQSTLLLPLFYTLTASKDVDNALKIASLVCTSELSPQQRKIWNQKVQACLALIPEGDAEKRKEVSLLTKLSGRQQQKMLLDELQKFSSGDNPSNQLQTLQFFQSYSKSLSNPDKDIYINAIRTCFNNTHGNAITDQQKAEFISNDPYRVLLELCKLWLEPSIPSKPLLDQVLPLVFDLSIETKKDSGICWEIAQKLLNSKPTNEYSWYLFQNFRRKLSTNHAKQLDEAYLENIFTHASPHTKSNILQRAFKWKELSKEILTTLEENDPLTIEDIIGEQPISSKRLLKLCKRKKDLLTVEMWNHIIQRLASEKDANLESKELYTLWIQSSAGKVSFATHLKNASKLTLSILSCAMKFENKNIINNTYSMLPSLLDHFVEKKNEAWAVYAEYISYSLDNYTKIKDTDIFISSYKKMDLDAANKIELTNLFLDKVKLLKSHKQDQALTTRCILLEHLLTFIKCQGETRFNFSDSLTKSVLDLFAGSLPLWPAQKLSIDACQDLVTLIYSAHFESKESLIKINFSSIDNWIKLLSWLASSGILDTSFKDPTQECIIKLKVLTIINAILEISKNQKTLSKLATECAKAKITLRNAKKKVTPLHTYIASMLSENYQKLALDPMHILDLLVDPSGKLWFGNKQKSAIKDCLELSDKYYKKESADPLAFKNNFKTNFIKIGVDPEQINILIPELEKAVGNNDILKKRIPTLLNDRLFKYPELISKICIICATQPTPTDCAQKIIEILTDQLIQENIQICKLMCKYSNTFNSNLPNATDHKIYSAPHVNHESIANSITELFLVYGNSSLYLQQLNETVIGLTKRKTYDINFGTEDRVANGKVIDYSYVHIFFEKEISMNIHSLKRMDSKKQEDFCSHFFHLFNNILSVTLSQTPTPSILVDTLDAYYSSFTLLVNEINLDKSMYKLSFKYKGKFLEFYKRIRDNEYLKLLNNFIPVVITMGTYYRDENEELSNDYEYYRNSARYQKFINKNSHK